MTVGRQYSANTTDTLTISFDFTIDDFATSGISGAQDRFALFGSSAAAGGSTNNNSWLIFGGQDISGLDGSLPADGGNWKFHNGTKGGNLENGGSGENSFINSGIALVLGDTYRFTVLDDPSAENYIVSVDNLDDAAAGFTSGTLGYRASAGTNPFINFGARISANNDTAGFTIDNVSIVPEPSSMLLSCFGALALFRRRRS